MTRRILAGLLIGTLALVTLRAADDAGQPAKKKDDGSIRDEAVVQQQRLARQFSEFEQALLRLAQRLERSSKPDDVSRAKTLKDAIRASSDKNINTNFQKLIETLRTSKGIQLDDIKQAAEDAQLLAEDIRHILSLLLSDNRDQQIRDEKEHVKKLLVMLDKVLRDQKVVRAQTEVGRVDKDKLQNSQQKVTENTKDLARAIDKQAKESKLDSRNDGKEQNDKKQDSKDGDKKGDDQKKDTKNSDGKGSDQKNDGKDGDQKKDGKGSDQKKDGKDGDQKKDGKGSDQKKDGKDGDQKKDGKGSDQKKDGKDSDQKKDGKEDDPEPKIKTSQRKDAKDKEKDSKSGEQNKSGKTGDPKKDNKGSDGKKQDSGDKPPGDEQQKQAQQQQSPDQMPGKKQVQDAIDEQRKALKRLEEENRREASKNQDEAIRNLEEARKRLEALLRQLREEELERVLADLQRRCERMLTMQVAVLEDTVRLDKVIQQNSDRRPDRTQEQESLKLSDREQEISREADRALQVLAAEGSAVAFAEVFTQVRDDMRNVSRRLGKVDVAHVTQAIEQDIISMLKEMIEALKQQQQKMQEQKNQPPPDQQQQQQQQQNNLIDLIQELRMIRSMQMQVNNRTLTYGKQYQGEQAGEPGIVKELADLAQRQQKIFQVTNDIARGKNK